MNSIRTRLAIALFAGLLALFGLYGGSQYLFLRHAFIAELDKHLCDQADAFAATSERDRTGALDFDLVSGSLQKFQQSRHEEYFEVWDSAGTAVVRSNSLGNQDLPRFVELPPTHVIRDIRLPNGHRGRAVAITVVPQDTEEVDPGTSKVVYAPGPLTLVLARSRVRLDRDLDHLFEGTLVASLLFFVCLAFLVLGIVRKGLRPLVHVAEKAATIEVPHLGQRFETRNLPLELAPICGQLNALLDRIESSFARERRFTSDVAHELRTPLAELRSLAEVGIQEIAHDPASIDYADYFRDALAIALQMEHLVTSLLALSRCDSGLQGANAQMVDLAVLVQDAWRPHAVLADRRQLAVQLDLPASAGISTDPTILGAILGNLFSNAVEYSPEGGHVHIRLVRRADTLALNVSNTSVGLVASDVAQMFAPFWRKDSARSDTHHSGLGLALVEAYARLLHATVAATLESGGLVSIELTIGNVQNERVDPASRVDQEGDEV